MQKLKIDYDTDYQLDFEFLPTLIHVSKYSFGDSTNNLIESILSFLDIDEETFKYQDTNDGDFTELEKLLDKHCAAWERVYMYSHSGVTISTNPFSCRWDSGKIGYVFITKQKYREEFSVKRISKKAKQKATSFCEGMVEIIDDVLRGNVFGYTLTANDDEDVSESCWGFIGQDSESISYHISVDKIFVQKAFEQLEEDVEVVTNKEIREYLEAFGKKVKRGESMEYVELIMDNHICIEWREEQYYLPKGSSTKTGEDWFIYDFLKQNYCL